MRFLFALAIPVLAAAAWGIFAVPNDPSRSGAAPIAVPGWLRLLLELAFFAFAIWALSDLGFGTLSWVSALIIAIHYLSSYDRILWLLKQ